MILSLGFNQMCHNAEFALETPVFRTNHITSYISKEVREWMQLNRSPAVYVIVKNTLYRWRKITHSSWMENVRIILNTESTLCLLFVICVYAPLYYLLLACLFWRYISLQILTYNCLIVNFFHKSTVEQLIHISLLRVTKKETEVKNNNDPLKYDNMYILSTPFEIGLNFCNKI